MHQVVHVNLVSEGFKDYFKIKYNLKKLSFHTNGIDNDYTNFNI